MKVTRMSMFSGKIHTLEIEVTQEQLDELNSPNRRLIQEIVPNLTPDEREYLMTGVTKEEWDAEFGGEKEEE